MAIYTSRDRDLQYHLADFSNCDYTADANCAYDVTMSTVNSESTTTEELVAAAVSIYGACVRQYPVSGGFVTHIGT